ncbi:MAG: hypothetical protein K0S01_194 [Herbinix sp.]|jgi:hypothetical protein|nr:hypothetical protein [Herbinix sp.]
MKALDQFNEQTLSEENAKKYLNEREFIDYLSIPAEDRRSQMLALLEKPIANFTVINELFFRSKWAELIHKLYGENPITLLEVASGDADMIPQAMACSNPGSVYIAANMNKLLNESLLSKTKDLDLKVILVDDDAINIKKHVGGKAADIIAFQHGVNDVVQAILCDQVGVDTIYSDWMETLPKMIEIMQNEVRQETLEQNVKPIFLGLIGYLLETLKEDGIIAINHYMFQLDLDWGYPAELFENFMPVVRKWLAELNLCKEIFIDHFDEQWWIFLKKNI